LEKGQLQDVLEAFKAAGATPPKDKLLARGNVCLQNGQLQDALEVFKAAASVEVALSN
jgi:hypothetical protein